MTISLFSMLPDVETFLALEPEELGGVVLEHLNSLPTQERENLNCYNFGLDHTVREYPQDRHDELRAALMEAWSWLEREGLLIPKPGSSGWSLISRRGRRLASRERVDAYRRGNLLPRAQLHARIAQTVTATFLRGDYDTAVFQAFKEVEVAVRAATELTPTDIGVVLMRKAFDKHTGPLRDPGQPEAEREALAHLFAGAIGLYKNPHSHRSVALSDPHEAVEIVMLASHLLRVVDERIEEVSDSGSQ